MNPFEIQQLIRNKAFPDSARKSELIETHISWVILSDYYAFKIKKPLKYSFLDFSTIEKRLYYCKRELLLNTRFAPQMYLGIIPVMSAKGGFSIGTQEGKVVDYALMMKRMDMSRLMSQKLETGSVRLNDILQVADTVAQFHLSAPVVTFQRTADLVGAAFQDIQDVRPLLNSVEENILNRSLEISEDFLCTYEPLLQQRIRQGWVRDCHGDLHSGNIILDSPPILFDCIEFNDSWREIDVLSDIAFLCVDMEARGYENFSIAFANRYFQQLGVIPGELEIKLLGYYKLYRANVRAKVSLLQAAQQIDPLEKEKLLALSATFFSLMQRYMEQKNFLTHAA